MNAPADFPAVADRVRCFSAEVFREFLRSTRIAPDPSYDGDRTVTAGPIRIHFNTRAVEISFIDPYDDPDDDTPAVVYVPGTTFGPVVTVVEGLLSVLVPSDGGA